MNNGDLDFKLGEMQSLSDGLDFKVMRVVPDSQTTLLVLETIMNSAEYCGIKHATVTNLTAELSRNLDTILRNELEIKYLTDYAWKPTPLSPAHHIVVNSIVKTFGVSQEGIKFFSEMEVHEYNGTECGEVGSLPLSFSQFGGFQTVYALKVAQSVLKYALESG